VRNRLIPDDRIEEAVDYEHDQAAAAARATAHRNYCEHYRKSLIAIIEKEHLDLPGYAQEREALADPRYLEFLKGLEQAIFEDELHKHHVSASKTDVGAWQTMNKVEVAYKL
jgi:hypothetical protein